MRFTGWDPFRELNDLHQLAGRFLGTGAMARPRRRLEYPPLDVLEDGDGFVVVANLPGMDKEHIHISLHGQTLTLEGERASDASEAGRVIKRERGYGKFRRTVEFQTQVQSDGVKARYQDGVLSISVPKAETAKPRQISVNVEEQ